MKDKIISTVIAIAGVSLIYGMCAFVTYDLNPAHWHWFPRLTAAVMAVIFTIVSFIIDKE